jgi:ribonucleoside-diphosphate reductase alpha chain
LNTISPNGLTVLRKRYLRKKGSTHETPEELFSRVAKDIASGEDLPKKKKEELIEAYTNTMANLEFLPNTPTLVNAGANNGCAYAACYVLDVEDSLDNIFGVYRKAALIQKAGGGVGMDWSNIRPRDTLIKSTGYKTRGVVQFIKIYADSMSVVDQGGIRPSANMGILSVHHPDILEFINMKHSGAAQNMNISVAVTDEFMKAKDEGKKYTLYFPVYGNKEKAGELDAKDIWDKIIAMAWRVGDPGIVWIDRINRDNPTPALGVIRSSNPCGETFLYGSEACVLGSVNLVAMLKKKVDTDGVIVYEWDYDRINKTVPLAVRFLDSVLDVSPQPLQEIKDAMMKTRKIGLGVMGFADALIKMKIQYNSMQGLEQAEHIMGYVNSKAMDASIELGKEKGVFPAWDLDKLGTARRNAIVTTIAPTGSISLIAGVSSGIEPVYAIAYTRMAFGDKKLSELHADFDEEMRRRNINIPDMFDVIFNEHNGSIQKMNLPDDIKRTFVTAHDISPEWHVRMQSAFQKYTGNSISKTINMKKDSTIEDIDEAYRLSYKLGCKGVTIYRDGSKSTQVLSSGVQSQPMGQNGGFGPRVRIEAPTGRTYEIPFGFGDALITVNEDDIGLCEVIVKAGRSGSPIAAEAESLGRLVSLLMRCGVSTKYITKQLRGISAGETAFYKGGRTITSLADAVCAAIENHVGYKMPKGSVPTKDKYESILTYKQNCPECGMPVAHLSKCIECQSCGWSKCK